MYVVEQENVYVKKGRVTISSTDSHSVSILESESLNKDLNFVLQNQDTTKRQRKECKLMNKESYNKSQKHGTSFGTHVCAKYNIDLSFNNI